MDETYNIYKQKFSGRIKLCDYTREKGKLLIIFFHSAAADVSSSSIK